MRYSTSASLLMGLCLGFGLQIFQTAQGATRIRNGTTGNLNVAASWGGGVPGLGDWAKWDLTSSTSGALGANLHWAGIHLTTPGSLVTISSNGEHALTLGSEGIIIEDTASGMVISAPLNLRSLTGQVWKIGDNQFLDISGSFTRSEASTLNVQGNGEVWFTGSNLSNDSTGIVGTWFTTGTGANTRYAEIQGSGKVSAYQSEDVTLSGFTSETGNYETDDLGVLASGAVANTLRYTGAAGTISGDLTVNGILNAGTGTLALSGNVTIGAQRELVITTPDATRNIELKGVISDHASGASDVVVAHNTMNAGTVIFQGANTYSGRTYVQSGILDVRHNSALGSLDEGTTIYTAKRATLRLTGSITSAEELTFTGGDPQGYNHSALFNNSGTNTLTGRIIMQDGLRIGGSGAANVLNIEGGVISEGNVNRQLVLNPNTSTFNFRNTALHLGAGGSFYFDQVGTVNLEVAGNTWGKTVISNGRLNLRVANALPSISVLQMGVGYGGASGILDLNGFNQTITRIEQAHSSPGIITSTGAATLTTEQGPGNTFFTGTFQGQLALVKRGNGSLNLGGNNTNTGDVSIQAGSIELLKTAASTATVQTYASSTSLVLNSTANLQVGQIVTGTNITSNTYITAISGNTITLSRGASATVSGTLNFSALNGSLAGSTLNYDNQGGSLIFGALMTTAELGGIKGAQSLALTNKNSGAVALSVGGNDQSTTYGGSFSGAGSLIKDGAGTLTLTNAHSFTGGTTIKEGALLLQHNGTESALGTGSVTTTAGSGAILGGAGSITGGTAQSITLNAGTFLRVGQTHGSAGTAAKLQLGANTAANLGITLAGTLQFDLFSSLTGTPESEADLLKLSTIGTVALQGGVVTVAALGDTSAWAVGDTWKLIDWAGTTRTGALTLGAMPTLAGASWTSFTDASGFYVQLAAIPEPSQAVLLLGGVLALSLRRKRN